MIPNFSNYVKALRMLHISLLFGAFMMGFILYNFVGLTQASGPTLITYIFMSIWMAIVGVNVMYWSGRVDLIKDEKNLNDKLGAYRSWFTVHCSLYQGPTFIAIVGCFFTDSSWYLLVLAAVSFLLLAYLHPFEQKVLDAINPNSNEMILIKSGERLLDKKD